MFVSLARQTSQLRVLNPQSGLIRMRAGSLGHHQAIEKDERFSAWRSEQMARLIWTLGAMAA